MIAQRRLVKVANLGPGDNSIRAAHIRWPVGFTFGWRAGASAARVRPRVARKVAARG